MFVDSCRPVRPLILQMAPLHRFLRFFFWHFYHGFAWTYDSVAAVVSIGRWNDWVRSALPYVRGPVLEIGHGPGHLQVCLHRSEPGLVIGLDESPQMGRLARKRVRQAGFFNINLTRGLAQSLPFADNTFETVVSTFPSEYIFEPPTLTEVRRVLAANGRFIVVPAAWIVGRRTLHKAAAWLFRVTAQSPRFPPEVMSERLRGHLEEAGFRPEFEVVRIRSSEVLVVIANL